MQKILIFFTLSLTVISAFNISSNSLSFRGVDAFTESREKSPSKSPIHSLIAPKEGKIRVVKGTIDQMAAVDLKENTDTNSKMLIALYTSTSLLAFNQGNQFQSYDCSQYDCQLKTGSSPTMSYPYFVASGSMASLSIWADYNNWVLSKTSPCFIATAFNLDKNNFEHKESFGYLALGYDNAEANFKNPNKNFLVYWKDNAFLVDFTYTEYSTSKVKMNVPADKNWIVSVESKFVFGTYIESLTGLGYKMILDINTDVIGLPLAIYNRVIEEFGTNGMKCVSTIHGPYLTCNGNYSNSLIPNMTIWFSDINSLQLSLSELVPNPPNENTVADFRVNVKALDPTLFNENYVTPAFEKYFIIGSNVLSKYTTVFNMSSQSIIAYEETGPSSEQVMSWLKWVIIGIIALIAACCLGVCFCCGLSAWCIGKLTGKKKETSGAYQHVSE